jgi:hypothetical protein
MSEIEQNSIWKQIDSSDYLFLNKLIEPRDNSLTIVLDEAKANHAKKGPTVIGSITLPGDSSPIEPTPDCQIFTLHWKNYVSYCVTEEMHGSRGKYEDETYTGRLLRVYSKSHYLDFVEKDTGAHFEPYHHYKICCSNHLIDVVSTDRPQISASTREEAIFVIN